MTISINKGSNYNEDVLITRVNQLFFTAFKQKFVYRLFSETDALTISQLFSEYICRIHPDKLIIAECDKQICGCLFMIDHNVSYSYFRYSIKKSFILKERIKIGLFFMFFSHNVKIDEVYIEFLSVSPSFRNKGIGRKLIEACKSQTTNMRLTLYVATENYPAVALYKKLEFVSTKMQTSYLSLLLSGFHKWHFMEYGVVK